MPLNLSVSDGEFTPYLKYNAKAGRFYVRPQGATTDVEIDRPRLAIDMANIRTGWLYYAEGSGPEKIWDPSASQIAPRPAGPRKFKRGFEVMVFGNDDVPGIGKIGLREFSSTAGNVITAILQMHAAYEAGLAANPEKIPFYVCTGVSPIAGAYGTNYEPRFDLRGWVERAKIPAFDEQARDMVPDYGATPLSAPAGRFDAPPPASENDYYGNRPSRGSVEISTGRQPMPDDEIPF